MNNPKINEENNNIFIILKLFKPWVLKILNSSLLIRSINKNWTLIKNINGKIIKSVEGTFKKVRKKGKKNLTFKSLKKFISSKTLKIKISKEKIKLILNILLKKSLIK